MFGFGEPFLEQASKQANDQPSKPNRQQRNESELHGTAAAHVKKGNIEQTKKENERKTETKK